MPWQDGDHRGRCSNLVALGVLTLTLLLCPTATAQQVKTIPEAQCPATGNPDPLLGPRTRIPGRWIGRGAVKPDLPIVVMAGHADSQAMASAGTPGFAVDKRRQESLTRPR